MKKIDESNIIKFKVAKLENRNIKNPIIDIELSQKVVKELSEINYHGFSNILHICFKDKMICSVSIVHSSISMYWQLPVIFYHKNSIFSKNSIIEVFYNVNNKEDWELDMGGIYKYDFLEYLKNCINIEKR